MIISIIILAGGVDIPSSMSTGDRLEHNGIFGLEKTMLALVKNPLSILNVSKRCCPPCENMVKLMIKKGLFEPGKQVNVAYPGHHTKWSATALPPFLPKEYVDQCIKYARNEALKKLLELQKRIDEDKASSNDLILLAPTPIPRIRVPKAGGQLIRTATLFLPETVRRERRVLQSRDQNRRQR